MNKWSLLGVILLMSLIAVFSVGFQAQPGNDFTPAVKETVREAQVTIDKDYGKMPLSFIPNKGQMDQRVYFYLQGKDKSVYFTSTGLTYALAGPTGNHPGTESKSKPGFPGEQREPRERELSQPSSRWVVKLDFVGAGKDVKPECLEKSGTVISYFKGKAEEWQTGLPAASKIIYRELWPGIDLVYYGTVNKMKYEFIVHPGADPAQIKLAYRGAASVMENSQGQLEVQTPVGGFFDDTPVAWQEIGGKRETVSLKYALEKRNPSNPQDPCTYGFSVGNYDKKETLILDPAVLVYCGYIGGSMDDESSGIAVDGSGCAYITGYTDSTETSFPVTVGPDMTYNGFFYETFVAKVRGDGASLVYCGYIGGSGNDYGNGIAVDASGCAYITGFTNSAETTFPVIVGPDLTYNGDDYDAFVAKISADGTSLNYCGYIGGSAWDESHDIAVDSSGCAYITGHTISHETSFPVAVGPDLTYNGGGYQDNNDAFVAKVKADGTGLDYCGYIGGSSRDFGNGIAVDGSGCAYITGYTYSYQTTFPVTVGPDLTQNGEDDAFVAKVRADGASLVYCGYIGGSGTEYSNGIAVDTSGCAYITGYTTSHETSFPVAVGPDLTSNGGGGGGDAFVAKVRADGTGLFYCGYIGGSSGDWGQRIVVDASGYAYVTGYTYSTEATFPVTIGPDLTFNGGDDAFVAKVMADGTGLDYCGYIGGSHNDRGLGIVADSSGYAYITGYTYSTEATFPVTVGPDMTYNDWRDVFVAKISWTAPTYTVNFATGTGGSLTGETTQTVAHGGDCTPVEAVPDPGCQFVNWTGTNGFVTTTANPLTVSNVTADMTITANFLLPGITGRVTDTGSNGIANVAVFVYESDGTYVSEVYTDGSGDYALTGIAAGSYKVEFNPWDAGNYIDEWYNDKAGIDSADPVTVTDGQTTTLADAVLETGGIISGRVTDGTNGIFNVMVEVNDLDNNQIKNAWTDSGGYYTLDSLPTGNFKIYFDTYAVNNYFSEWYNDKNDFSSADQVSVTAGQTTNLADAVLIEGGIISGTVKDSLGNGINGVAVRVYDLSSNYFSMDTTDSSGAYSITPLPPGNWKVYFDTLNAGNYLEEWYNDKSDFDSADQVSVSQGQTTTLADAVLMEGGIISGRVTDSQETGIESVSVYIYDLNEDFISNGYTDSSGNYSLQALTAGTYKVQFSPAYGNYLDEWYNDKSDFDSADQVSVSLGQTTALADTVLEEGGIIGGRVTDSLGTGILNVDIYVWALDGNILGVDYTDSNGDYTVEGIRAGDCKVSFETFDEINYISEWYNDKIDWDAADMVSVTAGQTTNLSDAVLTEGGTISGRVTDSLANGIENVAIYIYDLNQNYLTNGYTDPNGDYTLMAVLPGDCKVYFDTYSAGNYLEEWYNDQSDFASAGQVTVTAGQTTTLADAVLDVIDTGSISGRVTDSTGTTGIADVEVDIFDMEGNRLSGTTTDGNGDYTLQGYTAGDYKIQFVTRYTPGNYVGEWYDDKNSFAGADTVTVTIGQTTVLNDALLDNGGAISGRSTDVTGTIGVSAGVGVYDPDNNGLPAVGTSGDGYYQMNGVPAGTYKVYFFTDGRPNNYISGWHLDKDSFDNADTVQVSVGQTTTDIDGRLPEGGYISGRVTDLSNNGIANVDIQVYDMSENHIASASTDGNGDYTVSRLPAGDYKLQFTTGSAGNYIKEWYNNQGSFNDADTVSVSAGATTSGIDAQLAAGGILSGKVMNASLVGIENIAVSLYDTNNNWITDGWTDSNGDYSIQQLSTGNYKVYFDSRNAANSYLCEWYNDKGDFAGANAVAVTAGSTTNNINAVLAAGGTISGRVTDSTGTAGIANVSVQVCDLAQYWLYGTSTDSDGYYTINAVPTGNYKVLFDAYSLPGNYVSEWYNDRVTFNDAEVVNVIDGTVTGGIDARLANGGSISGRVTDSGSSGIANINVNVHDLSGNYITVASTDSNGDYTVQCIPAGNHKVQFWPWNAGNYIEEWYNDKNSFNNGDTVAVTAGNTTTGIDAQLAESGAISGRVTDSSGTVGIAGVEVTICDLNGYWYNGNNTDNDGYYTLNGLPGGDYKVQFWTGNTENYLEEWYNDRGSFNDADLVTVTAGSTTTGIDAQLAAGAIIHGKVMNSLLLGIENVQVSIYDLNFNWINNAWTDNLGDYTLQRLPTGNYKIYFDTWNTGNSYLREWYNDADEFDNAGEVAVTAGQVLNNINSVLAVGGAVSGRVTDSTGSVGIANVEVQICDLIQWHPGTNTDSDGYYTLKGLPGGDYKIEFRTQWLPGNYVGQWYNDQDSFDNADPVTVTVGQTTTGIDAQLADGGGVSGRVTDSSGTTGIGNVYVNICDLNQDWLHGVSTDNDGYYTIHGVPDGSFKIQFDPHNTGNYTLEWWNNKRSFDNADTVIVTTGNTVTDINGQLEQAGGITGTVSDESNEAAIENVRVYVYDLANNEMGNCWTDANGDYTVSNLYPGNFKVFFETTNAPIYIEEWYNDKDSFENADEATVNEGAATTVDAGLSAVQDDSYEPNNDFENAAEITTGPLNNLVYLSPQGEGVEQDWYKVYVGPEYAGQDLKVNIKVTSPYPLDPPGGWTSDLDFQIYDGTGGLLGVAVSSSDDETLYIANLSEGWYYINLQYCTIGYGPGGTGVYADYSMTVEISDTFVLGYISGRVTNEQGQGIGGSLVQLMHSPNNWAVSFPNIATDADGYYTVAYSPGDYTVLFNYHIYGLNPPAPNYVSEYYNDKTLQSDAQVFSLHVGASITGIDAELLAGGTIEGTLTHADGNPIVEGYQGQAAVYDKDTRYTVSYDYNDASGNYSVKYLPPGTYKVRFRGLDGNWQRYAREWYNNQPSLGTGDDVVISTVGQVVSGIDNQFSAGGILQGRVTDTSGGGIANVLVSVYHPSDPDNIMVSGYTNSNGDFYIREVFPGDVKIYFNADEQNTAYVSEWYNNQGDFNAADLVPVTAGQTTSGIDAQLSDKGSISGRVTDSSGTAGIANVNVNVHDLNGDGIDGTYTDENGYYTIMGLPAGDYKVEFNPQNASGNYIREWYNDKNSFDSADTVTVTDSQITGSIDAQLADGAAISGRVTDSSGTLGIENVNVQICDLTNNWYPGTSTDSDGYYTLQGLSPGNYKIQFSTESVPGNYIGEWYNDQSSFESADPLSVTSGQTLTGIDAQLVEGGAISGRVTDATGTVGIANVDVQIFHLANNWYTGTSTDSDGYYTLKGLPAGNYKIEFRTNWTPGNYVGEWYNDKFSFESADTVSVTVGQTTTGIDAWLANGSAISGRVTDSSGQGINNVDVQICDLNQYWFYGVNTDQDGYYTIYGLPAGNYKIRFLTNNTSGNYSSEWYNDKSSFESADAVPVSVGFTTTGIDAQLSEGAAISGRVTDSTGTVGIYNVDVQIYDLNYNWLNGTSTGSEGYYTIQGLSAGDCKIEFRTNWTPGDYVGEWYNDKDSFDSADTVSITVGQTTTGIDAQLADGGSISGRVTDSTGTVGIYNVNVNICDMNQYWLPGVSTDSDGYYTLHGVPAGDYKIQFNPNNAVGNYMGEWYNDQGSFENADTVSITVGQTTTGIDAQLTEAGSISGRVTDSSANGIQNVDVRVYDSNNNHINSGTTDSNGDYTVNWLPPGDCKVYVDASPAGNYVSQWYNDKGAFDEADVVAVIQGQTTGSIDAQLTDGGTISGRVTNESAEGIEGIRVRVLDPAGNWINAVDTDANGDYTVNRLAAGSYKVDFNPSFISESYIREWYNDKTSLNSADPVEVTAGGTTTIDAVLERGGTISGRVTNDTAAGIQNVRVDVKDMNNIRKAYAFTDENGDYTVKGFPGGSYKVYFNAYTSPGNYIPEWYNDKDSFANGDTISVTAGQITPGIDAVLVPGCSISGTVTDTSANPVQFVDIYACDIGGNFIYGAYTDSSGNYEVNGLLPGSYKVLFYSWNLNQYGIDYGLPRNYNYKYQYYNNKDTFANADVVAVTMESPATGIDAVLTEDSGIISGQITDSLGSPIAGALVYVFLEKDNFIDIETSDYTGPDGNYEVKGLPTANCIVMFLPPNGSSYRRILYNNTLDSDNATMVAVTAGQTTGGINAVLQKGGLITGRVTNESGNPLANVNLRLFDAATNKYLGFIGHGGTTNADGYYTLNAQAGQWKLVFQAWSIIGNGYVSEFYNDRSTVANADTLTVNVDETISNIDAVLSGGGGKISGYVKDPTDAGLYGVSIDVYDAQYKTYIGHAYTDTGGYFEVPGLMPGNYKIYTTYINIYPAEWYSDKTVHETADVVTVTEGGNTEIMIILGGNDPGATAVTGRVTDYSGSGIENVTVNIYDTGNNFIQSALTDINGDYAEPGIPPGDYKVYFDTGTAGNWLAEWYENKGAFDEADIITVATGQTLENIDAQLADGGVISGRVMNEAEAGVEGVLVRVRDLDSNLIATANTDANGDYTMQRLPADSYKVHFDVNNANGYYVGQWYNNRDSFDTAYIVVVMAGGTSTVDAILGDGIGISGTVTDNSANPLPGIEVDIYNTGGLYITYGYTDNSGNYEAKGLAPGSYKVNFVPVDLNYHGVDWYGLPADTNYKLQWYNNKEYFEDADAVTPAPGSAATGIDAVMTDGAGGIISGQITDSQANGIAGCFVYAFQAYDAVAWYYSDYMRTGADGNYQIKGLPGGDYIVFFTPPGGTFYRRQFYNNAMDRDLATMVSVTAGQTTPGINAVLQKGGTITGRVTDSSGQGLENVYIRLMAAATNKYLGYAGNGAQTDADGYYTMPAQPGQWKVMFQAFSMSNQGYVSEFYNNQSTVENGNIITVAAGEVVANINAVLSPGGGKISGFVKDPGNAGLDNAYIEVFDVQYQMFVGDTNADGNGYFEVHGLIPGNYKLYAAYNRVYPFEWYSDETVFAAADEITVTNGGNTQVLVMLGADDPGFPSITVTSPNGGESLTGGTTHDITWTGQENIEAVLIEYSIDNGASWITIVPFAENTGIYQWTVPETPGENCLVRIGVSDADAGPVDVSDAVFSIISTGPPGINLKSPNRWVSITAGTTEEITWHWTGGGEVDNIMLEYSIDSGQTWLMIVPGTVNTGSYFWYVPDTPSEHCLVRIQVGEGDDVLSNISEVEFSIVTPSAPVLHVTSPNGGETWKVGHFYNITWDTIGTIDNVKLEYSINGGGSWTGIIASTANTGSYQWTVPDSPAEDCLIRVTDAAGSSTDTGNESFAIVPASAATLEVTSPNGGESLTVGTTHDITWTGSETENVESVMIEYSFDNGDSWTTVVPGTAHNGSGGSYTWTVPDTPSETCLVRITDFSADEGPSDVSDGEFSIEPAPFITVATPNGGEQWQTGTTYAINWTYAGITGNVVIDLYRGTSFDCNITTTAVDTGSFDWNIPISFTNGDDYKVLIYQDTIEDYSDNYFAISDLAPNDPDFNNDGSVDILWRNYGSGGDEVWLMNGAVRSSTVSLQAEAGLDWRIVGTGDFNRDGKVDLLWRNYTSGQNRVWYMNGTAVTGTADLPVQADVTWQVAGAGDFNNDGSVDILWRNISGGRNQVWYMNGVTVTGYMGLPELKDTAWRIAGLGDFNDDDKVDILWRNYVTGYNQVWYMDGATRIGIVDILENTVLTWQIAGTGDFNKDGKIDILWRRYADGADMIWYMDGIVRIGDAYNIEARADLTWRIVGNGDYKE